ncbi:glycosyltransferase family 4 protein [Campylobacter concisus]|uniref:glycosyltransferase family 4 protein n=1 Tax=Campylobacter concisus TaxID=199 RepID=UPI001CB7210B|nr:glycosyltransferase family 1 protein [Campylobacter concisus]
MKKLIIDFRMHKASGIGIYIKSLLPYLVEKFDVILLGSRAEIQDYAWSKSVKILECKSKIYSIKEQLELPLKIPKCDIFWSPHYNIPILPIRAKFRVVTIHDAFHLAFYDTLNFMQKIYAKTILNQALSRSDIVLSVSNFSRSEILKYTKTDKNIFVVPNAIDERRFNQYCDSNTLEAVARDYSLPKDFVLFVGNVKPHKNLKNLLFALEKTNLNLVIVGKKDGFITGDSVISEIIQTKNLSNRIFFTGYVKDTDIAAIYNLAKLFVFPSLYEGFGIPPLEAQACGCPVVCSNAASLPEVCGDSVIYFDPHDVEDMRNKIQIVLSDENLRNELRAKGFENIKRFSWERSAKQIIEIMENL